MADRPQSFANHARLHPPYHYVLSPLSLAYVVWAVVRVVRTPGADALFDLLGALTLFGAVAFARLYPLTVQDRIIRLEERLRLERVLPDDLRSRIPELPTRQLIALRFAAEDEVADLVRAVLADPSLTPKAVKQRIRHWRADHHRV